jgi:hypothetical protein
MNPLHLVLIMLPVYFCLNLEIDDASNLHLRHIGDVAGRVRMAHILMTVNITQHLEMMKQLCTLTPQRSPGGQLIAGARQPNRDAGITLSHSPRGFDRE